jgi:PKD repeat protein
MRTLLLTRLRALALAALATTALTGCGLDKQTAPSLAGPSEFGMSISLTATPDQLSRDGRSVATLKVTVRDAGARPVNGQRLTLRATAGQLSAGEVVTNASGEATFELTAPPAEQEVNIVTVSATPVGTNFDNSQTRTVTIAVSGLAVPRAEFSVSPAAPRQFDPVTFDGSGTTLNGTACGGNCSFAWDFGDGTSATGAQVIHRYQTPATFVATLTATGPSGLATTRTRSVTVGAPAPLTVEITWSPTNPRTGETVFFDGRSSTTPDGVAIVDYQWDFGNGTTASGATATAVYPAARIYTVRLTIRDLLGRTQTKTMAVTVTLPTGP